MSAARRHAPAFQVTVGPQPLLQGLIALLASAAALAFVAALAAHRLALWWLLPGVPIAGLVGWYQARVEPRHLQWDGELWRLAIDDPHEPGLAVGLVVLMDFGGWLLLRAHAGWRRHYYLPLARKSLGTASWGQLRATLYSARPAVKT